MSKISMDLGPSASYGVVLPDALASSIHTGMLAGLTELGREVSAMIEVVLVTPDGISGGCTRCEVVYVHNFVLMGSLKLRTVFNLHERLGQSSDDVTRGAQRALVTTVLAALRRDAQAFTRKADTLSDLISTRTA